MVRLPLFERLEVRGYGLFPGQMADPGLSAEFLPGLTLILGANGLGKTTIVEILFRLLTGPFDIAGLESGEALGTRSLEPRRLQQASLSVFARRVADSARNATATLAFRIGEHRLVIERSLGNLTLVSFLVDDADRGVEEREYQSTVSELMGVWGFGDWILALHHLIFYFEDRRDLVWDPTAQRQIMRLLFLPMESARRWTQDEREILELDSRMRNIRAALFREERGMAEAEDKVASAPEIRAELKTLEELQRIDVAQREALDSEFVGADARRESARLRMLSSELERESRYRDVERATLIAIEARFPAGAESARYILAQLISEGSCLVCGNKVPEVAEDLEARISKHLCVVCASDISETDDKVVSSAVSDRRVAKANAALSAIDSELDAARLDLEDATVQHSSIVRTVAELDAAVANRSWRISSLVARLPPEETELHQQQSELASIRSRLEALREELDAKRAAFQEFLQSVQRDLVGGSQAICEAFEEYAMGFLLEDCALRWGSHRDRLGQTGQLMDFPAFELDMAGTDFESPVRRSGPDQVSESQREFIDLAFRMALMQVATSGGVGSLVVDAPESSLDAVFVTRAASVLGRFADPDRGNRLVITSNLTDGQLVPALLRTAAPADTDRRLVDLLKLAEPTAAIKQHRKEYGDVLRRMLSAARPSRSEPSRRAAAPKRRH